MHLFIYFILGFSFGKLIIGCIFKVQQLFQTNTYTHTGRNINTHTLSHIHTLSPAHTHTLTLSYRHKTCIAQTHNSNRHTKTKIHPTTQKIQPQKAHNPKPTTHTHTHTTYTHTSFSIFSTLSQPSNNSSSSPAICDHVLIRKYTKPANKRANILKQIQVHT